MGKEDTSCAFEFKVKDEFEDGNVSSKELSWTAACEEGAVARE